MSSYLTDEEYQAYWVKLEGIRKTISNDLKLTNGISTLDVGTGYGYFAIEMAKQLKNARIIGIDISSTDTNKATKLSKTTQTAHIFSVIKMDATALAFKNNTFDLATSFLAMRDIHMTKGKKGVKKTIQEITRVTKPHGKIVLCITPPEDMETQDQRIAVEIEGKVFGAVSLPRKFYADLFKQNNITIKRIRTYQTNKKMTANQTKTELKDGIKIVRKIYGKKPPTFKKVWQKYGNKIQTHGYGMYSKITTIQAEKTT